MIAQSITKYRNYNSYWNHGPTIQVTNERLIPEIIGLTPCIKNEEKTTIVTETGSVILVASIYIIVVPPLQPPPPTIITLTPISLVGLVQVASEV